MKHQKLYHRDHTLTETYLLNNSPCFSELDINLNVCNSRITEKISMYVLPSQFMLYYLNICQFISILFHSSNRCNSLL